MKEEKRERVFHLLEKPKSVVEGVNCKRGPRGKPGKAPCAKIGRMGLERKRKLRGKTGGEKKKKADGL